MNSSLRGCFVVSFLLTFTSLLLAQPGKDGAVTIATSNTVVNRYSPVTADVAAGDDSVDVVAQTSLLNLCPGDLILIYQAQGASINTGNSTNHGNVNTYNNAGHYEFRYVRYANGNRIYVDGGFTYAYSTTGKTQVIKVPQYSTLTISTGASLVAGAWRDTSVSSTVYRMGGIVVVHAASVVNDGTISASGLGFRGGQLDNNSSTGVNDYRSNSDQDGAEKGEGIAGYTVDYTSGAYCRGAAANGGGGANANNAGGGGGANGNNGKTWSGQGVMIVDANNPSSAWALDPGYISNGNALTNSSGGGRGGYSWSNNDDDATLTPPGDPLWGGDNRQEVGGLGGYPMTTINADNRLFFGGGGGAGDADIGLGSAGANGGGVVYIVATTSISGTGTISADGFSASNSAGDDGAGGGGGGGSIVVKSASIANTQSVTANGGSGGNQTIASTLAQGTGGGGGGGYVALSSGSVTPFVDGGANGTTNSSGLTEMTSNGATTGATGESTNSASTSFTVYNADSILAVGSNSPVCSGTSINLTASTIVGATYSWSGPNSFISTLQNPTIASSTLAMNGTYTVTITLGVCTFSNTVAVTVTNLPTPTASSNSPACSGATLNLSTPTVVGATYSWNGPNSFVSSSPTPSITNVTTAASGTYSVTVTVGGCVSSVGTTVVTINPTPLAPNPSSDSPACVGTSLQLSTNAVSGATYSWTGPASFNSPAQNPTITSVVFSNAGIYSLTITVNGCTSAAGTTSVTIVSPPATPSPTSNSPVCVGETINLNTTSISGATYSWTGPSSFASTALSPSITGVTLAEAGTYSLTVTVGGCTSDVGTTVVSVNPSPATPTASSNSPVCAGSTLNLSASSVTGATYSWSGPSFTSSSQNPSLSSATTAMSGTYSVTVTVGGCTSAPATTAVVVNALPATPNPSSNSPVCNGNTLNLSVPTVTGATYSWTGPSAFASSLQNPSITNTTSANGGTYSVTVTVGGCTSLAGTEVVTITSAPSTPTITSNSPVCVGNALNLSTPFVTGATYSWTGPNSFVSSSRTPTISNVTLADAGTYSVTITVGGCTSTAATEVVSIITSPAAPTATSNSPICAGDALTLNTPFVSSATYSWSGPSFTSTLRNPTITGATTASSGTYSVTITIGGCTSPAGTVAVVVNPVPGTPTITTNSPVCVGNPLNLSTPTVAGATYNWSGPGPFASTTQNPIRPTAIPSIAGVYSLTITVNGCVSATATASVVVNPKPATPTASSNTPVCTGETLNLNTPTVAGATYAWTGPSFSSTVQNPSRSPVTTAMGGTYSVTTTVNGCTSLPGTTLVTVRFTPATPSASSNSPVCIGGALNLTTPVVSSATYSWTGPASFNSTSQNPTRTPVTAAMAGTYSVTVTVLGCTSTAGTTSVTISPTPATPNPSSNTPLCAGDTLNLSVPTVAGATYSWTGPSLFNSTTQNPTRPNVTTAMAGTYSVTVTVDGCTSAPGTEAVVINAIPATPTASSNSPLCEGSTLNLTTPMVSGASYSWDGPGLFNASTPNTSIPSATPSNSGTYSVTVTVNGCQSLPGTEVVVINPTPASPIVGSNSPVCIGNSVNLTTTAVAGATYSWTGPNIFASSVQNPIISTATASAGGNYSLVITVNGCASAVGTTSVVMTTTQATPSISTNSPACIGNVLSLSTPTVVGATYSWSGPFFTSSLQNPVITGVTSANAGTYSLTVTVGGCSSSPATASVVVNPTPPTPTASNNSPVCAGSSFTLTTPVVAGATYSWTGPGNYNSSIHNPTITNSTLADAGTYSITVTIGGCTSDTGTTTVTIDPTPATPTASSNSPVCITNNINLTTPTVAGATYSWIGPGAYTSSAQNPIIVGATGADAGTYSVTVTVGGCTSQQGTTTVVMTANQIPPAVSSNSPVCIGDTIKLFADTIAGAVYSWTNPFFTSALQNPVIINATTANAGTYSLTVTVGGCSSSATTTIVAVNSPPPTPVVSSNSPVCIGSTINLSTPTVSGATYSWTGPNGFASTAQNPSISNVTASDAGTYSLTVSTGGCSSPSATVAVTISPGPSTPIASANTPICVGDSLKLTTAVVAGAVYNWSGPGAYLSSAQNPVIPNAQLNNGGDYILTITVGGCTSVPDTVSVIVNTPPTTPSILNNSPVCSGDTLFLSTPAVANATYNWSGPDNFTSNLQNPTIDSVTAFNAGIYNLTITIGSCSSSPSSAAISVDPSPSAPTIIASDTALCAGSTLNLTTATVPGGTYTWSGPATFQSALQSPSITSIPIQASGIYSLTITVNGCTSAPGTELITVDTVPIIPLVTSNSPACLGGVLTLTADSVAGAVYAWIGPNGILPATTTTATVNGVTTADAGIYKVVIALGGCVSDTGTTTVTTIAPPSIPTASSNSPVCEGTTLNLTTPTVAGATYNWFGPNNYTASTQNPSIAAVPANAGGNYSVVITVGGCSSDSGTTAVVVLPAPAAPVVTSNSPTCIGDTIRLQTALVAGAVYAWTGPNTFSSSLQNPTIANATAADTGIYSLTITANGCTSAPGTTFVSVIVCTDTDGDGIIDAADIDDDNDGILDATENLTAVSNDTDGDGVSDRLDLDSDNDGIADVTEAGGSDPDNDGVVGLGSIIDANGDGLADNLPGSGLSAIDTDNDGRPNFQDLDSDGDSINDLYESGGIQPDANGDGVVDDPDSDNDGLADSSDADNGGALTNPLWDSDADGTPNYTDVDSDNDGVNDGTNGEFPDLNCDDDTISNYLDTDPCQLVIPNGFSPDGDNINDLFVINGLDAYPGTNLKIMNRWGNLVYESSNYDNTWDGVSNRNAVLFGDSKVPPGTYYYVIELTSGQTLPGTTSTTQTGFIEIRY